MIKSLFSKIFGGGPGKKLEAPKSFKQKNRSIFLNRYAGAVYFLITWHMFGYFIMKIAKTKAENEGLSFHQAIVGDQSIKKIEIGSDFKVKITDSDDERPSI